MTSRGYFLILSTVLACACSLPFSLAADASGSSEDRHSSAGGARAKARKEKEGVAKGSSSVAGGQSASPGQSPARVNYGEYSGQSNNAMAAGAGVSYVGSTNASTSAASDSAQIHNYSWGNSGNQSAGNRTWTQSTLAPATLTAPTVFTGNADGVAANNAGYPTSQPVYHRISQHRWGYYDANDINDPNNPNNRQNPNSPYYVQPSAEILARRKWAEDEAAKHPWTGRPLN